jgi:hypothetical protein
MKSIKLTLLLLTIIFSLLSCKKNDDSKPTPPVYPEENFLNSFLLTTQFNQKTTNQNSGAGYWNMGLAFKPKVNGTINSVLIKLPSSDGGVIVRIWKVSTQALLKTIPIIVATNNLQVISSIDKLPLLKDEEYIITMKVNSWFERRTTNNSIVNLPIEVNNIKITGIINTTSTLDSYPAISNSVTSSFYFGDISFNFQQTE